MRLSSLEWNEYFARNCKLCNGAKYQTVNGARFVCPCQIKASYKYRLESIEVTPPELKYLDWKDFTGQITSGGVVVGSLNPDAAVRAKRQALSYCFGSFDESVLSDRRNTSQISKRLRPGNNVVIGGPRGSGKSLLACLIIKEVIRWSFYHRKDLTFKWVKYSNLQKLATWDSNVVDEYRKHVDYGALSSLSACDFLVIDGVGFVRGEKPPDLHALNTVFGARELEGLPVITVCSSDFLESLRRPDMHKAITDRLGEAFLSLATDSRNTVIELSLHEVEHATV